MWTLDKAVRRRYVHGMVGLGVWYVRLLLERREIGAGEVEAALCRRVDLYRFTDFWNGVDGAAEGLNDPAWMEVAGEIAAWVRASEFPDTAALEERVLGRLERTMEARLPKDVGPPPVRPLGCWTWELGWEGLADGPGLLGKLRNLEHMATTVRRAVGLPARRSQEGVLHMMNVLVPRSPLEDLPALAADLRALMTEVREREPQVRRLWCNTWLNEHPRFLELFPESWRRSGRVAPAGNHRNWWGQFARRDGDFNEAAAARFRASGGVFRFRAMLCHAEMEAIEGHLWERSGL